MDASETAFSRWMKRHRLTVREAAKVLGAAPSTVQRWQTVEPPLYILMACAAYSTGVPPIR